MSPGNTGFMADDRGFFKHENNKINIHNVVNLNVMECSLC